MMDGLRELRLNDRDQGELLLAVAIPKNGNVWGVLAPLQGTPWAGLVRTVPGEALSHALHGYATPLVRVLGPDPRRIGRRLTEKDARCAQHRTCPNAGPACRVGLAVPDCYEAPRAAEIATFVALLLRDGWHVLVASGAEFSIP